MSSGAKRPPAEVSVFAPAGASSCKPKRRKQSTPIRISGESGPDPPLPAPSPTSPQDLQSPNEHPQSPKYEGYPVYGQNESYVTKDQDNFDGTNNTGYFHKFREQILEDDKFNQLGLTISRVRDDKNDQTYRGDDDRLHPFNTDAFQRNSDDERIKIEYDGFKKAKHDDADRSVSNSGSPESGDKFLPNTNGRYTCARCGLLFPNADLLRLHYDNEHERNGRMPQIECKVEPFDAEDSPRTSSGPTPAPLTDPRMDPWNVEFQNKMADLYKNALNFPHEISKESLPPNFNPLCPPFPLFSSAVPPQRPLMEPIRIFNPEAYCELCSKEFCNKYFLKTHKANKHGIYENTPSSSSAEGLGMEPMMPNIASTALKFKSNMMLAEYAKSYEAALLASQRHKAKIQRMMEEAREADKNAESIPNPVNVRHEDRSNSDDNTIPENFIFKGDRHEDEPFMTPTPRKLSPDSSKRARDSGFNADTLRRLGVINPEAFCKICCKEYCNKYFLKTHKIKRHGLLPSPTDRSVKDTEERKDSQTSPLNLIMSEDNQDKQQHSPETLKPKCPSVTSNVRPQSSQSVDSSSVDDKKDDDKTDPKQSPTTIFISEDLQKLQTMISQLNDLSVNKIVECYICKKEFENNYILQFHMMSDHGINASTDAFAFPNADEPEQKTMCTICDKEFPSLISLKKHIEECHTQKLSFPEKNSIEEKDLTIQRERRASMSLTPTNSYCEICNKELCNKYFMKTHMQRMHGIEIENGTQIGGVICDICNKELCSKYFLRVHKHNTHGIVEPGAPLPQMRNLTGEQEVFNPPPVASPLKPPEASILSNRFIAHFVEVCPFCSRRFRTSKWLKAHLLSDHGKAGIDKWKELEVQYKAQAKTQGKKQPIAAPDANSNPTSSQMDVNDRIPFYSKLNEPKILNLFGMNNPDMKTYNCSYCPFSTSILSFLYVHEKSHAQGQEMDILCPMCPESFNKPEALQLHIITSHSLPEWRERPGASPNQCQRPKTPEHDDKTHNGNKTELFECYECDFKSCNFTEMESHLKTQHCAVKETAAYDPDADRDNYNDVKRSKMPAIYAVPKCLDGGNESTEPTSITMQPFVIEENAPEIGGGKFVPSVVFLPVRRRATGAITISFNLTPA